MRFLGLDRALCLSPHPDDVELSMSGTIKKYKDTVFRVLCCSIGTQSDSSSGVQRHQEMLNFWKKMECENVELYFVEDFINLRREDEWVNYFEENFLADAQAIFTTSSEDSHFEHKIVRNVSVAMTRHKTLSLIEYRSFSTLWEWVPNMFTDITGGYDLKVSALQEISSQSNKNYFTKDVLDAFHTDMQCSKKLLKRVEQFKLVTIYE